ncbi:MAG TPA: SulP family inorganic anion transporter [Granulicella sp.]
MAFKNWGKDFSASLVVFLVALPLCMGIAIASGLPPAKGLITGVLGGIVVGTFAGSPLQVSGPAAGLAVVVFELVQNYGISALGPILMLAGLFQIIAGLLKLGQWFRAISPAVIHGMLAGIGLLIVLQQFHVMLDHKPSSSGPANFIGMFTAAARDILPLDGRGEEFALLLGLITIAVMMLWQRYRPEKLRLLPGALLGILAATTVAQVFHVPVKRVDVPSNLLTVIDLPSMAFFGNVPWGVILSSAFVMAFIASAETLLSAAAVDRMQSHVKTNYDRELTAQGVGNMLCGLAGALPMTGVIVRSSANVQAGAETRRSAILHGVWILLFITLLPGLLRMVPISSLAGVLVYTGARLVSLEEIKKLGRFGRIPLLIYAATLLTIVAKDLLTGVLVGVGLSVIQLLWRATHVQVYLEDNEQGGGKRLILAGAATFLRIPRISAALEQVPAGSVVHVDMSRLHHVDHACLELLERWIEDHRAQGTLIALEWEHLEQRYWQQSPQQLEEV